MFTVSVIKLSIAEDAPFFLLKLRYRGDTLVEAVLNGAPVAL